VLTLILGYLPPAKTLAAALLHIVCDQCRYTLYQLTTILQKARY
jgi:hypothetical protein